MKNRITQAAIVLALIPGWGALALADNTNRTNTQTLETMTVTANKTAADKQELPSAVSAFDGDSLEELGLSKLEDVVMNTPNINLLKADAHGVQYTFRGIGGTKNMNMIYYVNVDDVVFPYAATDTLLDVERIEILRGGQGALYGSNTHTGLINIVTRDPEFTTPTGEFGLSYEKFNTFRGEAIVSGAANDTMAYRLALAYTTTDGYFENTYYDQDDSNDSDQLTGRLKFLFLPTDKDQLTLSIYADQFDSAFDAYGPVGQEISLKTQNDETGDNSGDILSPTLKWEHALDDNRTLTSITNYSHSTYGLTQDWDFTSYDMAIGEVDETFDTLSQELKISGEANDRIQWIAGVFARYQSMDNSTVMRYGTATGPMAGAYDRQDSTVESQNLAGYGQVVYRATPNIELTGALRADYEKKELDWANQSATGSPVSSFTADKDWTAFSPSASAAWIFSSDQRLYATVARGFKAGDYNYAMPYVQTAQSDPVDPEYTMTYELGYKSRHLNDRLEFNADLFYVDWTDMQVDIQFPGTTMYEKLNAADAHTSGLELEARFRISGGWTVFAGLGYMFEYEFDEFIDGDNDYSGNKLPFTNEYTVNLGTTLNTASGFFMGMNVAFRGPYYLVEDNSAEQDSCVLMNAKLGYTFDEQWEVSVYGRNLLDEEYATSSFSGALMQGEPLTVGMALKYRF